MRLFLKSAALLLLFLAAWSKKPEAAPVALFGTVEFRNESLDALPQWQRALRVLAKEQSGYEACGRAGRGCATAALAAWHELLQAQAGRTRLQQVRAVNEFVNRWPYRPDQENYGKSDYWATPSEFFARSGDCEDYAITKYVTLRLLGFSPDELRMVVVKDVRRNLAHAILAVTVAEENYILDNLAERALPQSEVTHYKPYYSVNEEARFAHAVAQPALAAAAAVRPAAKRVGRLSIPALTGAGQ